MSRKVRMSLACLVTFYLLPAMAFAKVELETGRIRMLYIGDAFVRPLFPTTIFIQDPRIDPTLVPAEVAIIGDREARRHYRLYLPRTEECVKTEFDVICITGAQQHHLRGSFLFWTRDAVVDDGVGFLMVDDPASFGGVAGPWGQCMSWDETVISDVLPVVCATDKVDWGTFPFRLKIELPEHPLVVGIPWNQVWLHAHNRVHDKPGSTVVARTSVNPKGRPAIAYWEVGKGISLAFLHDWGGRREWAFSETGGVWEYAPHVFASLVYYPARLPIPDVVWDKNVREKFSTFHIQRLLFLSLIDFADRFGANTAPLLRELSGIEEERSAAEKAFIDMDLQASFHRMDLAISEMEAMLAKATKAKDRALLWVHVVEWFTLTGTSLACGYVLYMLMVRRKLYREVGETHLHA